MPDHDHAHDHAPAAPLTPPVAPPAPPAAPGGDGHDHAHAHEAAGAHGGPEGRSLNGCGCLLLVGAFAAALAAAGTCAGLIDDHRNPSTIPSWPIAPQNSPRGGTPLSAVSCSAAQLQQIDAATRKRDALVVNPGVRSTLGSRPSSLTAPLRQNCAPYENHPTVSAWTQDGVNFNYGTDFFSDSSRVGTCRRASDLLALEACQASVGNLSCTDAAGIQAIGDHNKLPAGIRTVWDKAYAACLTLP